MKNSLILLGLLGLQQAFAQTGNVGINTDNPTQALDVNGNARIRTLEEETSSTNFPYQVVAKTDGTLGKRANPKWILADMDINGTVHTYQDLPSELITTNSYIDTNLTQELTGSELYFTVPNEDNILTLINWNCWLHISPTSTSPQSGSFRYYAKYQEVDNNNQLIGNPSYTATVYMASFAGVVQQPDFRGVYRVTAAPSIMDKGSYFKKGKRYKITLTYGIESATSNITEIRNWGITSQAQTFYQN